MNPITKEEADQFNSIVSQMTLAEKDEVLGNIIGKGPTVADPYIRSVINRN